MRNWSGHAAFLCLAAVAATAAAAESPKVEGAWIRATPPMATTAAAYVTIHGTGESDRLIGASSELAEMVEIHTTVHQDGLMQMKQIPAIAIPARGSAALSPGGEHLMLLGLKGSPKPGETFVITLQFERAGSVDVTFPVVDARSASR
jgi:hypothetical protein